MSASELPSSAKIVIVGGGIVGSSVAYHLGAIGQTDVLLIERNKLTSGSTWHAAGLVGQLRSSANITQLLGYSVALYDRLEAETGQATGWKRNGGLRLACNSERWTEVKRQATTARSFGLEMQLLSAKEAQDLWPLMQVDDVVGAAFLPTDGQASPSDIAAALAKGARRKGVTIREGVAIVGVEVENGAVRAVVTSVGRVACEKLVICAGQWSRAVGRLAGVQVPLTSIRHQYIVTEAVAGVTSGLPTLRDPDRLTYWKEEVGGLVMGGYEPNPKPWAADPLPEDFEFQLLQPDWDHFEPIMELALGRVPALREVGVRQMINGPESFTPDGNFILGEAPEARNIFVGAGFNAFGIASGGGAGMALAEWVVKGAPPFDLWPGTSGDSGAIISIRTGSARARSKPTRNITRWRGRRRNIAPGGRSDVRRCTIVSARRAPSSAKSSDGSAPTGLRKREKPPRIAIRTSGQIGSAPWRANIGRRVRRRRCSTRRPSPSSACPGLTPRRFSPRSPPTMCARSTARSSTHRCLMTAAGSKPISPSCVTRRILSRLSPAPDSPRTTSTGSGLRFREASKRRFLTSRHKTPCS